MCGAWLLYVALPCYCYRPVAAIAAATATSKAPCTDTFSPWDGDNVPLEVPEVQECLVGPCRGVWEVTAITPWGGKGKLMGSKGPTYFFIVLFLIIMFLFY